MDISSSFPKRDLHYGAVPNSRAGQNKKGVKHEDLNLYLCQQVFISTVFVRDLGSLSFILLEAHVTRSVA